MRARRLLTVFPSCDISLLDDQLIEEQNPSRSHLCLFCSGRFAAELSSLRPTEAQRRSLQSSRPTSNPPSAAEAVQEEYDQIYENHGQMQLGNSLAEASSREGAGWTRQPALTDLKAVAEQPQRAPMQAQTTTPLVRRVYAQKEVSDRSHWRASATPNRRPYGGPIQGVGEREINPVNDDFVGPSHIGKGVSARHHPGNQAIGQRKPLIGRGSFGMAGARVGGGGGVDAGSGVWTPNSWPQRSGRDDQEERRQFLEKRAKRDGKEENGVFSNSLVGGPSIAKESIVNAPIVSDDKPGVGFPSPGRQRRREQKFALGRELGLMDNQIPVKGRERARGRRRTDFAVGHGDEDLKGAKGRVRKREKLARWKSVKKAATPAIPVLLPEFISVANLARVLRVRIEDFIKKMEELGFEEMRYDHVLNSETAGLIAMEYNYEPIAEHNNTEDLHAQPPTDDKSLLAPRPPVVTIMGHVDHGKTTILDWLRKSSVAASEHGGITQHIGAFSVSMPSGNLITFLDTPGHAAFLSMRQRGANVTDVVVLVVAADDSVKPQTIEAIKHAKNAKVPIVVAINKIDKEEADVERVKLDLARHGVEVEDFGGDTQVVCVSGKTGQGMGDLEESVVTLSEILDLRAETAGPAEGWVIESSTKKEGRVATVLVRRGTLRGGDVIVAGPTWARVRRLRNEAGVEVAEASPGTPVEIDGWKEQPNAGDEVLQAPDEAKAKSVIEFRLERAERFKLAEDMEAINDSRRAEQERRTNSTSGGNESEVGSERRDGRGKLKEVCFIIKGDVSGSVEAVLNSVLALGNDEVRPQVLRSGVGPVGEFDLEHAAAAKGHVISFNTIVDPHISRQAESLGVTVMDHQIIYRLVDDVKAKLSEQLTPNITCRVTGEAEVAQVFDINVRGRTSKPVAGCKVRNGLINRNAKVRVLRDKEVIYTGALVSLKNVKKDVNEMRKGGECGMGFENWDCFEVGDQVQCFEEVVEKRTL
ncbi:MAG: hypothetical protein M1839_007293 [Geoglossum umbratile]|nr:MAG: hypothetical protein M1839_007293 [Geoglossum umbratile]